MNIRVPVVREDKTIPLPAYESERAAGMDARSTVDAIIQPMSVKIVPTGLKVAVPDGYTLDVDSRSGLAAKKMVFVMNAPGIVDPDYRGGVGVILANFGQEPFEVKKGDRICQFVFRSFERAEFEECATLPETTRAAGGFGSTGIK